MLLIVIVKEKLRYRAVFLNTAVVDSQITLKARRAVSYLLSTTSQL